MRFLALFAVTGDERWLERARAFAMHAIAQVELRPIGVRHRPPLALDWRSGNGALPRRLHRRARARCDPVTRTVISSIAPWPQTAPCASSTAFPEAPARTLSVWQRRFSRSSKVASREVELVTGVGGIFDVHVDGDLVFTKSMLGRYPDPEDVMPLLRERLG